jgi:hypothetical protein
MGEEGWDNFYKLHGTTQRQCCYRWGMRPIFSPDAYHMLSYVNLCCELLFCHGWGYGRIFSIDTSFLSSDRHFRLCSSYNAIDCATSGLWMSRIQCSLLFISFFASTLTFSGWVWMSELRTSLHKVNSYSNSNTYRTGLWNSVHRTRQFLVDMWFTLLFIMELNKVALAVNPLVYTGEVLGSNLVRDTYCLDWCSLLFSSVPSGKYIHELLIAYPFHLTIHSMPYGLICWQHLYINQK